MGAPFPIPRFQSDTVPPPESLWGHRFCAGPVERAVRQSPSAWWADLREDKMLIPAPGFWQNFGPLGPTAGPGSSGNGPGSNNSAGGTKNQPRRPILSLIRGHFVFLGPTAKNTLKINDKFEAPQGLPRVRQSPSVWWSGLFWPRIPSGDEQAFGRLP